MGIQFSFQAEKLTEQVQKLLSNKDIHWDGIKKQPCAKTIFEFAINSSWISNRTMKYEKLTELVKSSWQAFIIEKIRLLMDSLLRLRIYRMKEGNDFHRNYRRFKLCECQESPAILIGKFA